MGGNGPGAPQPHRRGGSRTTHLASKAAEQLAAKLRSCLDERLPRALPSAPDTVTLQHDRYVDQADGSVIASFDTVAAAVVPFDQPVELGAEWDSTTGDVDDGGYTFAACAIEVRVDRETGRVGPLDALLVVRQGAK